MKSPNILLFTNTGMTILQQITDFLNIQGNGSESELSITLNELN